MGKGKKGKTKKKIHKKIRKKGDMMSKRILVTGAGGFIGHHLVKRLVNDGQFVRGVDIKNPEYEPTDANEFMLLDLREWDNCVAATKDVDEVYNLAADMGGDWIHNRKIS